MSKRISAAELAPLAVVHGTPGQAALGQQTIRSFELPTGLYVATAACYFGFLAVLSLALMEPQLVIPMAICVVFVTMFFAVPRKWQTMAPDHPARNLSWSRFKQAGIMTHTGPMTARDAMAQVLILPVLILIWACVIALIRALV